MMATVSYLLHSDIIDKFNVIHGENFLNKLVTGIVSFDSQEQDNHHDECIYLLDFNKNHYDENSIIDFVHHAASFNMYILVLVGEEASFNNSYLNLLRHHCKELNVPAFAIKSKYSFKDLKYNLLQHIALSHYTYNKKKCLFRM